MAVLLIPLVITARAVGTANLKSQFLFVKVSTLNVEADYTTSTILPRFLLIFAAWLINSLLLADAVIITASAPIPPVKSSTVLTTSVDEAFTPFMPLLLAMSIFSDQHPIR
jgi:hypothetical protein